MRNGLWALFKPIKQNLVCLGFRHGFLLRSDTCESLFSWRSFLSFCLWLSFSFGGLFIEFISINRLCGIDKLLLLSCKEIFACLFRTYLIKIAHVFFVFTILNFISFLFHLLSIRSKFCLLFSFVILKFLKSLLLKAFFFLDVHKKILERILAVFFFLYEDILVSVFFHKSNSRRL